MESVVSEGTGKNARVSGYSIGGKTGTSEDGVNTGKYVTSFVGVADIPDPEVAIIIILYNPTGEQEEEVIETVTMPEVTGMSITDAKKALKELGLEVEIIGEGETVGDQLPKTGIKINTRTKVTIYAN